MQTDVIKVWKKRIVANVREIEAIISKLVNKGDLEFVTLSDGACATNAGAAHLFRDQKYGPNFRLFFNNYIASLLSGKWV